MIEIVVPIPYSLSSSLLLSFAIWLFVSVAVLRLLAAIWDALPFA